MASRKTPIYFDEYKKENKFQGFTAYSEQEVRKAVTAIPDK
jgi:hypothetical protein